MINGIENDPRFTWARATGDRDAMQWGFDARPVALGGPLAWFMAWVAGVFS